MSKRLDTGDIAPEFTLPTVEGSVSLDGLLEQAEAGVIVYFYPRAATPGCTTEACDFRDNHSALKDAGYRLVGISPDPISKLAAFAEAEGLNFPLASDEDKSIMSAYGAWGEKKNYGKTVTGVIRSTIVVAKDGTVAHALYNVKATGHVARVAKLLGVAN